MQNYPNHPYQKLQTFLERKTFLQNKPNPLSKISTANSSFVVDTVVSKTTYNTERYSFSYDAKGRVVSKITENLKNGQFEKRYCESYTYDSVTHTKTKLVEKYFNSNWINDSRTISVCDVAGNEISYLTQYDVYGLWENSMRISRTFTTNGDLTSELSELWKDGKWENWWREKRVYDDKNHLTFYSSEEWKNDNWEFVDQMSWIIEERESQLFYLEKSIVNGEWINAELYQQKLDAKGNVVSSIHNIWKNSNWEIISNTNFTYNEVGRLLSIKEEFWVDGKCDSIFYNSYTYKGSDKPKSVLREKFYKGIWVNVFRQVYEYDSNNNVVNFNSDIWNNSEWKPYDGSLCAENMDEWFHGFDISLHYKSLDQFVGIESEKLPSGFELHQNYPNPFNPETTISYQLPKSEYVTLKLYDILGKEIATLVDEYKQAGFYNYKFSISNLQLASGVYLYKLSAGNFRSVKKFIVLK
ncbi:MAG: T9SS type A sorting domain-containing protein [Melioribacteraceae bacterium]